MVISVSPLPSKTFTTNQQSTNFVNQTLQNYQTNSLNQSAKTTQNVYTSMANYPTNVYNNVSVNTDSLANALRTHTSSILNSVNTTINSLNNAVSAQSRGLLDSVNSLLRGIDKDTGVEATRHKETINADKANFENLSKQVSDAINKATDKIANREQLTKDDIDSLGKAFSKDFWDSFYNLFVGDIDLSQFDFVNDFIEFVRTVKEYIEDRFESTGDARDRLINNDYLSVEDLFSDLFDSDLSSGIAHVVLSLAGIIRLIPAVVNAYNAKALTNLNRLALSESEPTLPSAFDILTMIRREYIDPTVGFKMLRQSGWSEELIQALSFLSGNYPDITVLSEALRRGLIDEHTFNNGLVNQNINEDLFELYKELTTYQPTAQDVIRFSVRDVFDEELAELSGIFDGWDNPDYLEWGRKAGLSDDALRLYWGAHWFYPSVQQGYEMLFRGEITRDELEALFRAADVAPKWREPLLNIAYKVPTRVDTRRMFISDVLNEQQTLDIIKAQGYNDEHANFLLQWYIDEKNRVNGTVPEVREFTQATILKLVRLNLLSHNDAIQRLVELGYNSRDAALLLLAANTDNNLNEQVEYLDRQRVRLRNIYEKSYMNRFISRNDALQGLIQTGLSDQQANALLGMLDREFEIEYRSNIVEQTSKLYIGYEIDDNKFRITLTEYGFSSGEIERLLDKYAPMRELRYRDLTTKQISDAVIGGIITYEQGMNQLRGNGYSDNDATIIARLEQWQESALSP